MTPTETMPLVATPLPEALAQNPFVPEIHRQQEELNLLYEPTARTRTFRSVVDHTPLLPVSSDLVPELAGYDVLVKHDGAQPGGAYKIRGAMNALMRALEQNPETKTVVAASTGNHGRTLGIAAQALGVPSVRVMCTRDVSPFKLDAMRQNNILVDASFDTLPDALAAAQSAGEEDNIAYIEPYNALSTIAGQGTATQEVIADLQSMEYQNNFDLSRYTITEFLPAGGGGYVAGNAVAASGSGIRVVASQMEGCAGIAAALRGEVLDPNSVDTSCDGAAVAVPGDKPMSIIRDPRLVSEVRVVPKHEVGRAMRLLSHIHESPEPAGALAFAAMLQYVRENPAPSDGSRHLLIPFTSGINATPAKLSEFAHAEFTHHSEEYGKRTVYGLREAFALAANRPA